MRSSEIAELAGVTVRTLRHYHQIGVLDEPARSANGYRDYDVRHLVRRHAAVPGVLPDGPRPGVREAGGTAAGYGGAEPRFLALGPDTAEEEVARVADDIVGLYEPVLAQLGDLPGVDLSPPGPALLAEYTESVLNECQRRVVELMGERWAAILGDPEPDDTVSHADRDRLPPDEQR